MIGPNGKSLLHKLGLQLAHEMPEQSFLELISREQERRTFQRAMGRVIRKAKDHPTKLKLIRLEQLGLDPDTCTRLRATGMDESILIRKIKEAGLI